MNEVRGRDILREVKAKCEPFKSEFNGKKVTILRFTPPPEETDPTELAKYEAARYSTDSKVKTFQFLGCEVDSKLLNHETTLEDFESILQTANEDPLTLGIIVQNPIPKKKIKQILKIISPEKDLDGMQENHPLFKASATSETIARLVKSFADENTLVAVVGARGFVGRGVVKLLEENNIQCIGLDEGDDLLKIREADIVVSATGVPELLDSRHLVSKHRLVVDAGFVPTEQGILGDVKRSAYDIPENLTPVPGGVGPLQMATLLERLITVATDKNIDKWTYQAARNSAQLNTEPVTQTSPKDRSDSPTSTAITQPLETDFEDDQDKLKPETDKSELANTRQDEQQDYIIAEALLNFARAADIQQGEGLFVRCGTLYVTQEGDRTSISVVSEENEETFNGVLSNGNWTIPEGANRLGNEQKIAILNLPHSEAEYDKLAAAQALIEVFQNWLPDQFASQESTSFNWSEQDETGNEVVLYEFELIRLPDGSKQLLGSEPNTKTQVFEATFKEGKAPEINQCDIPTEQIEEIINESQLPPNTINNTSPNLPSKQEQSEKDQL